MSGFRKPSAIFYSAGNPSSGLKEGWHYRLANGTYAVARTRRMARKMRAIAIQMGKPPRKNPYGPGDPAETDGT